jgi:hypothetical protein
MVWAAYLRLADFQHWWLSPDEGIYYHIATAPPEVAKSVIASHAHPPLYYSLLRAIALVTPEIEWLRAPSLVAGTILVLLSYLGVRGMGGPLAGLVAAVFVAGSPSAIMLSQVIRPYMVQLAVVGLAAVVLLSRHPRLGRWYRYALYCPIMLVALFLHYSTFLILLGVALTATLLLLRRRLSRIDAGLLLLAHLPLGAGALYLYLFHLRPRLGEGSPTGLDQSGWVGHVQSQFVDGIGDLGRAVFGAIQYSAGYWCAALALSMLVLGLLWLSKAKKAATPSREVSLAVLCVLAGAVLMSCAKLYPLGRSRHSVYLLLFLTPCVGLEVARLLRSTRRFEAVIGCAALAMILGNTGLATVGASAAHRKHLGRELKVSRADAEDFKRCVSSETQEGDVILLGLQNLYQTIPLLGDRSAPVNLGDPPWARRFQAMKRWWVYPFSWRLQARPKDMGRVAHLGSLVLQLKQDSLLSMEGRNIWVVQGGYGGPCMGIPARNGTGQRNRSEPLGNPELGLFRLHWGPYLRWLREGVEE